MTDVHYHPPDAESAPPPVDDAQRDRQLAWAAQAFNLSLALSGMLVVVLALWLGAHGWSAARLRACAAASVALVLINLLVYHRLTRARRIR